LIKESVSKTVLADVKDPLVTTYLDYKLHAKKVGTYGEAFLKHVNPSTGRIHTSFFQILDTGRTASSSPNCYSADTEILTEDGWVRFDELTTKSKVAQWDDEQISFVTPTAYYKGRDSLVEIKTTHIQMKVTPNHRCLVRKSAYQEVEAQHFPNWAKHVHSGITTSARSENL
jgi:hypothetical protein